MKKFIISLFKIVPWLYLIVGIVVVFANPPRTSLGDEDAVLFFAILLGIILSSFMMYGFSYIVDAACLYLDKHNEKEEAEV